MIFRGSKPLKEGRVGVLGRQRTMLVYAPTSEGRTACFCFPLCEMEVVLFMYQEFAIRGNYRLIDKTIAPGTHWDPVKSTIPGS